MITKSEIRKTYQENRKNFSKDYMSASAKKINLKLIDIVLGHMNQNSILGGYHSIGTEICLDDLFIEISKRKNPLSLPWIDYKNHSMSFKNWQHGDPLDKSSNFYCPQPQDHCKTIVPSIIIAPLITCDLSGTRIGYGKGYYDKYIAQHRKDTLLIIGVCYDKNIYPKQIPTDDHDCKLDAIVTEERSIFF